MHGRKEVRVKRMIEVRRALADRCAQGHEHTIAQHIARTSDDVLKVEQGSLYPALERLLAKGWATAKWGETSTKRRARFYTITASGKKHLGDAMSDYDRSALAIARVLGRA